MTERTLNCIKAFRHAVVDSLKTANLTGIGSNVSASREMNAWPEEQSFKERAPVFIMRNLNSTSTFTPGAF